MAALQATSGGVTPVHLRVVKSFRSASVGADFLTRCGRHLLLKYNIDSGAFYKVVERFCLVTHLCYAAVEKHSDGAATNGEATQALPRKRSAMGTESRSTEGR
ncbi:uncharacterized protein [Dermacentor albipictus]|uniref:uncharacterized protein n=1 Tax=Dermacentor albipictus TaxID=60249 RepID=UPI0038FC81DF